MDASKLISLRKRVSLRKRRTHDSSASLPEKGGKRRTKSLAPPPEQGDNLETTGRNKKKMQKTKTFWRQIGSLMYRLEVAQSEDDSTGTDLAVLAEVSNTTGTGEDDSGNLAMLVKVGKSILTKWRGKAGRPRLTRTPRKVPVHVSIAKEAPTKDQDGSSGALSQCVTARMLPFQPELNEHANTGDKILKAPEETTIFDLSRSRKEKKGQKRKIRGCEEEAGNIGGLNLTAETAPDLTNLKKSRHSKVPFGKEKTGESSGLNPVRFITKDAPERKIKNQERKRRKGDSLDEVSLPLVVRKSGSGSRKGKAKPSVSRPLVEQSESIPGRFPPENGKANRRKFLGINFYKRINRWTTHIWVPKHVSKKVGDKGKQKYIGSFATATEAMRAYDKASIKFFGKDAKLNNQRTDYISDINEMDGVTHESYIDGLRKSSDMSKPVQVVQSATKSIIRCPAGMFEVKILESGPPKKKWKYLGRFENLEDAIRIYAQA